jgi:hypothetical protein
MRAENDEVPVGVAANHGSCAGPIGILVLDGSESGVTQARGRRPELVFREKEYGEVFATKRTEHAP